jgi:hypothetical protein
MKTGCPRCGQPGRPAALRTLKHHVKPEHLRTVEAGQFHFCRTAGCDVVYFNDSGIVLTRADVRERIGLKETSDPVPLCYCFGFTEKMALDEIRATGRAPFPNASPPRSKRVTAPVKSATRKAHAVWAMSPPWFGDCYNRWPEALPYRMPDFRF